MAGMDPEPLVRLVRNSGFINRTLQGICGFEGISKGGNKSELQDKIVERIREHARNSDNASLERLKNMLERPNAIPPPGSPYSPMASTSSATAAPPPTPRLGAPVVTFNMGGGVTGFRGQGYNGGLEFKPSPFYQTIQQIGETKTLEAMANHRHSATIPIRVSDHPVLSRFSNDPSLRIMVFCSSDNRGRQDITFPHQSEIKVNGGEIKANLRGLKNKAGSTRPVDITKELRLKMASYSNNVEMTYALTSKKFYLLIYVVKIIPVGDLVKKLETGNRITKERVLTDMVDKARDTDIVATASVLSLKCPLSTLRIDLPCRSSSCRHNQCFDATSYLQLQQQGPTWLCPICNNSAPFDTLVVDEYVRDILMSTSKSVDQVTIQPNGKWELHAKPEPTSRPNGFFASDDDDDLVEITRSGDSVRMSTPRTLGTPVGLSHISSPAASKSTGSTSGKRPIAAVIDLTSSGDDDEEPLHRQPKRQYTSGTSNGFANNTPAYRPPPASGYAPHP